MINDKASVLDRIRRQLGRDLTDPRFRVEATERLQSHPRNTVPARAQQTGAASIDLFEQMLTTLQGSVARVDSVDQVPAAVKAYLDVAEADICVNGEVEALHLHWETEPGIRLVPWVARSSMGVSVTGCIAAAAETGTVVVASSNLNPLTLNFLAERHIVVLFADQIVGSYEDVWDLIRRRGIPRDVTFISGPSCTGDIEMMLEYGAHGPGALHVIVVNERPRR